MIRLLNENDDVILMKYLKKETIVNYFIILSLERSVYEEMFCKKWGEFNEQNELIAVLLKRKTGNMQFYSRSQCDYRAFSEILKIEGFNKLIGEEMSINNFKSYCVFSREEKGPFIAKLENYINFYKIKDHSRLKNLEADDIDRVVKLYEKCFKGFATKKSMIEKLENRTGRGYYIEVGNDIVSIAQTSYEEEKSALITGVATDPKYQGKGFASICISKLLSELVKEGKALYLQYDNEAAGSIYNKMGFHDIGRMAFYYN